jgi:hypothetical protein
VESSIGRFGEQVRRVDVHLSNENSQKHADGEQLLHDGSTRVRLCAGGRERPCRKPAPVDHAATGKLKRALDSALGRLNDKKMREPVPVEDALEDKNLTSGS